MILRDRSTFEGPCPCTFALLLCAHSRPQSVGSLTKTGRL